MHYAKDIPQIKNVVREVVEVKGGSIEYRLSEDAVRHGIDQRELRREVENAIRHFRERRPQKAR